jgi:hypothetical protein
VDFIRLAFADDVENHLGAGSRRLGGLRQSDHAAVVSNGGELELRLKRLIAA